MPPMTQKKQVSRPRTVKLDGEPQLSSRRFDPLSAFSTQSIPNSTPKLLSSRKEKGKAKEDTKPSEVEDYLWVDRYAPTSEAELAVHVKKVESVRQWLSESFDGGSSGQLCKYRRILALTGPAGAGKTCTVRVLAKEMDFEILEWRNTMSETFPGDYNTDTLPDGYEGHITKFEAFLTRAATCNNLFSQLSDHQSKRRIILLEDLPNILHLQTQAQFHQALNSFVHSLPSNPPTPLVVIVSDAGMRGEAVDEGRVENGGWSRDRNQVVDVRTVLSKDLLSGPYVTQIGFNPIAPTLMRKALQVMLNNHFSSAESCLNLAPSKEALDLIVEASNGDIRNAIMTLQFSCVMSAPSKKTKASKRSSTLILETTTRREQSLALFHLIGKVLYNKRKDDSPGASTSAKDAKKEKELDRLLKNPPLLPSHLHMHDRRASRVDVDSLYADSPIETSLLSLYIHQNYTQFCTDLEQCEGISDWLSWIDASGGDAWYIANPHQFHLLTLGTLHCLPSPVPRRSQKTYKPDFFSFLQKEKDAADGASSTRAWINQYCIDAASGRRAGGWSKNEVVLELGGILKARDANEQLSMSTPNMHRLFSRIEFIRTEDNGRFQPLDETGLPEDRDESYHLFDVPTSSLTKEEKGGWLESDDIEDFD